MKKEWLCKCGKLLGVLEGTRLHIKFSKAHEYRVGIPVTNVCRYCGTLNELGNINEVLKSAGAIQL